MSITEIAEPSRAPARSRADTRRRLVAAGTDLFARRGLHATTTVDVARAAGVGAGTFYLHFPDKHALFREIVLDAFAQLRERLARASARAGDDPIARLRARVEELLDFAEENRSLVRVLFGRDHEAVDLSEEVFDDTVLGIEAGLRRRLGGGASAQLDPAVAAQGLAAMWARVVAWWLEDPSRAPRAHVAQTLVELHPFSRR